MKSVLSTSPFQSFTFSVGTPSSPPKQAQTAPSPATSSPQNSAPKQNGVNGVHKPEEVTALRKQLAEMMSENFRLKAEREKLNTELHTVKAEVQQLKSDMMNLEEQTCVVHVS